MAMAGLECLSIASRQVLHVDLCSKKEFAWGARGIWEKIGMIYYRNTVEVV